METNRPFRLEVSKNFQVPVEVLFAAWNDPEQLKHWWKPMGNQLREVTNDLTVGGTIRYVFTEDSLIISGNYEEVKENERLVYSWNWDFPQDPLKNAAFKLTVDFVKEDNSSTIRIVQEENQQEETLQVNEDGWNKGLAELEAYLQGSVQSGGKEPKGSTAEEAGYRERPEQQKVGGG
jgi:uncharacterized protein YndB with AHSA1/START domain